MKKQQNRSHIQFMKECNFSFMQSPTPPPTVILELCHLTCSVVEAKVQVGFQILYKAINKAIGHY